MVDEAKNIRCIFWHVQRFVQFWNFIFRTKKTALKITIFTFFSPMCHILQPASRQSESYMLSRLRNSKTQPNFARVKISPEKGPLFPNQKETFVCFFTRAPCATSCSQPARNAKTIFFRAASETARRPLISRQNVSKSVPRRGLTRLLSWAPSEALLKMTFVISFPPLRHILQPASPQSIS